MLPHLSADLLVYSGLALAGLSGYWLPFLKGLNLRLPTPAPAPAPAPVVTPEGQWQSDTVDTLIRLQATLESREMAPAVKLCRELIWEVLGGDKP
jgi:hypothetical protein